MEPEIIPPGPGFEGVRVRVAHVRSLGFLGAFLALMTMLAAVGFGLLMLFWRALLAAAVTAILWPHVFSREFTLWVFGAERAPFWKMFLLMALLGTLAKALRPTSWERRR
ncbi:MAG: hypothetical protein HY552_06525 [Elusimicrobia bacterium]|nr:hypothetical protein [Elusimicrobiota bacterium]